MTVSVYIFGVANNLVLSSHAMSVLQIYTFISYKLVTQQVKNEKGKVG